LYNAPSHKEAEMTRTTQMRSTASIEENNFVTTNNIIELLGSLCGSLCNLYAKLSKLDRAVEEYIIQQQKGDINENENQI
jgi:hypothetical protein